MRIRIFVILACLSISILGCFEKRHYQKGFQVDNNLTNPQEEQKDGLHKDSLVFETKPTTVLLTGMTNLRLVSLYKVNYKKDGKSYFTGSNDFHYKYRDEEEIAKITGNNWNNHIIPGFEAAFGYNFVNVAGHNLVDNKTVKFFDKPALINTLYYPSFTKDTLNFKPVDRNYFMASVYDEDTNNDGYINLVDLRRMYLFDSNCIKKGALIPTNYSVFKSAYDSANDVMFIFAQEDKNGNGKRDVKEPIHIFWVDLKDPTKTGKLY